MQDVTLEYVEHLAGQLSIPDQQVLAKHLTSKLQSSNTDGKQLRSLRGIWKKKMPEDLDLDAELREIRRGWLKELDDPTT
jgi:hypothetical protein